MKPLHDYKKLIAKLPPNLSQVSAAARLGLPAAAVRHWILRLGYKSGDGRRSSWTEARRKASRKADHAKFDWSKPNIVLAQMSGISRERIRQIRDSLNIAKVGVRKKQKTQTTKTT